VLLHMNLGSRKGCCLTGALGNEMVLLHLNFFIEERGL